MNTREQNLIEEANRRIKLALSLPQPVQQMRVREIFDEFCRPMLEEELRREWMPAECDKIVQEYVRDHEVEILKEAETRLAERIRQKVSREFAKFYAHIVSGGRLTIQQQASWHTV